MRGYDYIIVGQGLAGTALAYKLVNKGARICVIHDQQGHSSSRVAAGLFNPVTGRKMVKTWNADVLFPELIRFYTELENLCGHHFLHLTPIYRPFISNEEQNEWMGKSASDEFSQYVKEIRTRPGFSWTNDPKGGVVLENSGYLDIPTYLDGMSFILKEKADWHSGKVNYREIRPEKDWVKVGDLSAAHVIFCEGTYATQNPYFSWLPFRPVKGELLEIEMQADPGEIVNRGVFILPLGNGRFRAGSTYDNQDGSWEPTMAGRKRITDQLDQLIKIPYKIVAHYAGVRPATADRRPIAGRHPEYETISVLNGLGTKGVSLAPFVAEELTNLLIEGIEPDKEVNINRYFSLY